MLLQLRLKNLAFVSQQVQKEQQFLHKIVLAASIGIETMSAGLSRLNSFIAMGVFAGSPGA